MSNFVGRGAGLGNFLQLFDQGDNRLVDAALQIHRVHAGGNELHAFADNRLCQHGGGRGAITGDVGSLGSHFLDHLRAHVLELVFQLDFLGDRNTVLGHGGGTVGAIKNHIAAFGAERYFNSVSQNVDATNHALASRVAKQNFFCSHYVSP